MELNAHQNTIFLDRYSKRDQDNNPTEDNVVQMFKRVADEIGNDNKERGSFYDLLYGFKFVPGGRILAGAGTESEKTYYNCFVIPVETKARRQARSSAAKLLPSWADSDTGSDSREAIFDTVATMVDIMSRGGGVGVNWSTLRPRNAYLRRISGTSSGPVGWMNVASVAVGEVIQGGSRRGAAMFMLNDWHPDIEEFVTAKEDPNVIKNANVSVAISDEFMRAVESDGEWSLRFPDTSDSRYNTDWDGDLARWEKSGGGVKSYKTIRARDLWAKIARSAWGSGEPGIVFIDRYNAQSTAGEAENIICVNPCGEQGLGAYSVCNLGSMNLAAYVCEDEENGGMKFCTDKFAADVKVAVRFLDNVIDKTHYMHEDSKRRQEDLRRVGLGIMGLADMLIKMGVTYGSAKAVEWVDHIYRTMKDAAIEASAELATQRGPAKAWNDDMWNRPYLKEYAERHPKKGMAPLRNLFLLTQAPTGTTAALAGVNSGIEPYFDFTYVRKDRTGTHVINAEIVSWAQTHGIKPSVLVTTNDLTPKQHLIMQAAAQKYIDSSVSKTINAPNDATMESVLEAYSMAWDLGLKGLAYYRDGSRSEQVLHHTDTESKGAYSAHPSTNLDKPAMPMIAFANQTADTCPVCGSTAIRAEGCSKCSSCSWSAC